MQRSAVVALWLAAGSAVVAGQETFRCDRFELTLPAGWRGESRGERVVITPGDGTSLAVVYTGTRRPAPDVDGAFAAAWREAVADQTLLEERPTERSKAADGVLWRAKGGAVRSAAGEPAVLLLLAAELDGALEPFVIVAAPEAVQAHLEAVQTMILGARWRPGRREAPPAPGPAPAPEGGDDYLPAAAVAARPGWAGSLNGRWLEVSGAITERVLSATPDRVLLQLHESGRLLELTLGEGSYRLEWAYASNYGFKGAAFVSETGTWARRGDRLQLRPERCQARYRVGQRESLEEDRHLSPRDYALETVTLEELVVDGRTPRRRVGLRLVGPRPGWMPLSEDELRAELQRVASRR